jgi:uncharacterized protein DUF4388
MTSKFQYRGNLAETPLPKVLAKIHRYRVPGVVTARGPDVVKQIFLDDGKIVFAASSDMDDALGAFLVKRGLLTAEQLAESGERIAGTGHRQGEVLIEMGVLTPPQMGSAVLAQVSAILWSIFDWESGEVTFEVGRFRAGEKVRLDLPIDRAIRDGLLKAANAKSLVKRLGPSWTVLERTRDIAPTFALAPDEEKFLSLIDGRTPFVDLCRKGPGDAATNARLLFLFFCLELIQRKSESSAKKIHWRTPAPGGASGK